MRIPSWNIQATKGCDERYDASRIISQIEAFGDLNIDAESDMYQQHISGEHWIDCWTAQQNNKRQSQRQPTCGIHDHIQWLQGPHVRDYFLATDIIAAKIINVEVNIITVASDHQPVLLETAL